MVSKNIENVIIGSAMVKDNLFGFVCLKLDY